MSTGSPSINTWIEGIKVNRVWTEDDGGRIFHLKQRRPNAAVLGAIASGFFLLARSPLRLFVSLSGWQRWEVETFLGLHGRDGFRAFARGQDTVGAEALPGQNLTIALDAGTITPAMTAAAGRELKRAHEWKSPLLNALWSHADPHAGNFIYDAATDRARIIDFEARHSHRLSARDRQIDDVCVFLQDVVGRIPAEKWQDCAASFLAGYGSPELAGAAVQKLGTHPWGAGYLWKRIRTSFLPGPELQRRIDELARATVSKS